MSFYNYCALGSADIITIHFTICCDIQMEKTSTDAVIAARALEIAEQHRSLATHQQTCAALQGQLESLQAGAQPLEVSYNHNNYVTLLLI